MPMYIRNNNAANLVLGEWKKNESKLAKDLKQASSGTKLNSAGDAASEYAISEKMRVKLRGLNQDIMNVQNGRSLLSVADGGIQNIIDELRSLKELAINSANDHNSDQDRATIQKEFDQRKAQIDDIANDTNYNGIPLLNGMWCQKGWTTSTGAAKVISKTTNTTTSSSPTTVTQVGPTTKWNPPVTTSNTSTNTATTTSDTAPTTGTTTVGPVTQPAVTTSKTSTTGPTTISSKSTTSTKSSTSKTGKLTTVVDTKIVTATSTDMTTTTKTDTTTVQAITTTTMVSAVKRTEIVKDEPILITNGTTSIDTDGVYQFAPDYTGTLNVTAQKVEIMGPKNGATLTNVHIVDQGVDDLYLKNVSIDNTDDVSVIAFDSSTSNTLHLLGTNSITEICPTAKDVYNRRHKAIVNAGGGLSIVGNGSLAITSEREASGALIGSDQDASCGDIAIGQSVTLNLQSRMNSGGAGIGSGSNSSSCGNIYIGSNATVNVTMNNVVSYDKNRLATPSPGAAIGAGNLTTHTSGPSCGKIIIYSNANVSAIAQGGAGIGCGEHGSNCGNITIYSHAKVTAASDWSAAIGTGNGGYEPPASKVSPTYGKTHCGYITIFSYSSGDVQATSNFSDAQDIGLGNTSTKFSPYTSVDGVYLYNSESSKTGGIKDFSELPLGQSTKDVWDVTTTTITKTDTTVTTVETTTIDYATKTTNTETTTTTVYEDGAEEKQPVLRQPLIIHTGTKSNQHLRVYIEDMRPEALGIDGVRVDTRDHASAALEK